MHREVQEVFDPWWNTRSEDDDLSIFEWTNNSDISDKKEN